MKEGCFGDVLHMLIKGEGLVKDNAEIANVGGGEHNGSVNGEGEVDGFGESVWTSDNDFGFVSVQFEEVGLEPGLYFHDAVGQS